MSRVVYEEIMNDAIKVTSKKILNEEPQIIKGAELLSPIRVEEFNTILGIVGDISGQIIFGFSSGTPGEIVSKMLRRQVEEDSELCLSGIAEFANILSGNAVTELFEETGGKIDITPPSIVTGKEVTLSTTIKDISVYELAYETIGKVKVYIAIKELEEK